MDSGVLSGEETFTQPSSPWGESAVSGREGFSSCAHAAQGPRLASRVPQRRRALSLSGQGRREEKAPSQSGRGVEGAKTFLRGLRSSPPYPKSRASGDRSGLPQPPGHRAGVPWWQRESTTSDFRTESTRSSDPSRRGWPGRQRQRQRQRQREEGTRSGQGGGGRQGQPGGVKIVQEGDKTPPATIELVLPSSGA